MVTTPNGTTSNALVVADISHVLWAVNLGCLGLHLWPYRADDPDHADELRIDLDPQPGTSFDDVRTAAAHVRELLDELGMVGYPKTTGNRGIHVYVRLEPRWDSFSVRAGAVALARELERRHPDLITANWWKEERGERVFVDFNQNAPHKTVFGAWFARPRVGGQVSTPLAWDEVDSVDPEELTIRTVPELVRRRGDPWAGIGEDPQSLQPLLDMAARTDPTDCTTRRGRPSTRSSPTSHPGWRRVEPRRARTRWTRSPRCGASPTCSSGTAPSPTRCGPFARRPRPSPSCPPANLAAMSPARLQKIPGVGKTSAQVIIEAAAGATPAYLEKLESADQPV